MAHAVETMAYNRAEKPWHGLGNAVSADLTPEQMAIAAGLGWEVSRVPLLVPNVSVIDSSAPYVALNVPVPGHMALQRNTDGAVLGICSPRFEPVQNADTLGFFKEFVEAGDATMETAGALRGGKQVWALAKLGVDFELPGGDKSLGYLLVSNSHEPGRALLIKPTSVRVVCWNTLTLSLGMAEAGQSFRHIHSAKFDDNARKRARATILGSKAELQMFAAQAAVLKRKTLDEREAVRFVAGLVAESARAAEDAVSAYWGEAGVRKNRAVECVMLSYTLAPGADPGTAWGVLNAVTHYVDHVAGRSRDTALASAWMGQGAVLKQKALAQLLAA